MISLCISNFSLSRCQKWEKVTTLPRIDHTHSQKGPIAIQLFFFAHQTREDGMVSVRGNQKIERGKGLYIQYKIIIQMPRGPQRGLAGWGLILLLTTPLIIERAPSLAIQLFFFAHQTYGTMTSLSIPSTSSGSSISLSKLASTAFALFEHYIGAMVPLIYQTYSCHSLPSYIHWTALFPQYYQQKWK